MDQWAVEYDKSDGATVTWRSLVSKTSYLKKTPRCPGGGSYGQVFTVGGGVGDDPTCDYTPPAWFDTQGGKYGHCILTNYY